LQEWSVWRFSWRTGLTRACLPACRICGAAQPGANCAKGRQSVLDENARSEAAMTERWDHSLEAQITSKMHELIACMCVVNVKQEGDRRGIIERIESLTLGKDFPESFDRSQFKVHLTSGDVVIVPGSAISAIESTAAGSDSAHTRKERGRKARKAGTKPMPESIAIKPLKTSAKARTRRAKQRAAQAHWAKVKQSKVRGDLIFRETLNSIRGLRPCWFRPPWGTFPDR
jgi:hypothetical protein